MIIKNRYAQLILIAIILASLPILLANHTYALRVVITTLLFACLSQAWNFLCGLSGYISLGHAAFFGIGGYVAILLANVFGLGLVPSILVATALSTIIAILIGLPTIRLKGHYFALATLAFGEIFRILANSWVALTGGPVGLSFDQQPDLIPSLPISNNIVIYYLLLLFFVVIYATFLMVEKNKLGYMLQALRGSPLAAELLGVPTVWVKLCAFIVSGCFIAVGGVIYAYYSRFIDPDGMFSLLDVSLLMALICIVGGIGTIWGPLLGAILIIPTEEILNSYFSGMGGVSYLTYAILLIAVILFEPRGITHIINRALATITRRDVNPNIT